MKRINPTPDLGPRQPDKAGEVEDLLRKLRELDERDLEQVSGGRCGANCMRCKVAQN
jgi:hypothetical protein